MRRRPPTKMMRIREVDLKILKEIARQRGKKLPDIQRELIKYYRRRK